MTINQAIKQAVAESSIYRQGGGWVMSTWSESYRAWELTMERPYGCARYWLRDWRINRAIELAGGDPGNWSATHQGGDWRGVVRLFFDRTGGVRA